MRQSGAATNDLRGTAVQRRGMYGIVLCAQRWCGGAACGQPGHVVQPRRCPRRRRGCAEIRFAAVGNGSMPAPAGRSYRRVARAAVCRCPTNNSSAVAWHAIHASAALETGGSSACAPLPSCSRSGRGVQAWRCRRRRYSAARTRDSIVKCHHQMREFRRVSTRQSYEVAIRCLCGKNGVRSAQSAARQYYA